MESKLIELTSFYDYEFEILRIEHELRNIQSAYHFGPQEPKGSMDWDRVILADGTDARYCPPHGSNGSSVAQLYDYEEELNQKLEELQIMLAKTVYNEILSKIMLTT